MVFLKVILIIALITVAFVFGLIMMVIISAALSLKDIDLDNEDPDIIHNYTNDVGWMDVI